MSADFLAALRRHAGRRLTVAGPDAMNIFLRLNAHLDGESAREAFVETVRALAPGALSLPRDPRHWDAAARPHVPRWLRLKREVKLTPPRPDHRSQPWCAALQFVATMPALRSIQDALVLDHWIRAMPETEPWVPIKERSWELFGDEKKLDRLRDSVLFVSGRLTLDHLRCYVVPCTPVHRMFPDAQPRLIISENEAGFDSLCRVARELGFFRCVVFGDGNTIEKAGEFLAVTVKEVGATEWLYAGDIDVAGLAIASRLAAWLSQRHGVRLSPWLRYYAYLLRDVGTDENVGATVGASWLPPELDARAQALFAQRVRRAQEGVGWKVLRTWNSP